MIQEEIISASTKGLDETYDVQYFKKPGQMISIDTYPLLLQWDLYHQSVKKWNNDRTQDTLDDLPKKVNIFKHQFNICSLLANTFNIYSIIIHNCFISSG